MASQQQDCVFHLLLRRKIRLLIEWVPLFNHWILSSGVCIAFLDTLAPRSIHLSVGGNASKASSSLSLPGVTGPATPCGCVTTWWHVSSSHRSAYWSLSAGGNVAQCGWTRVAVWPSAAIWPPSRTTGFYRSKPAAGDTTAEWWTLSLSNDVKSGATFLAEATEKYTHLF